MLLFALLPSGTEVSVDVDETGTLSAVARAVEAAAGVSADFRLCLRHPDGSEVGDPSQPLCGSGLEDGCRVVVDAVPRPFTVLVRQLTGRVVRCQVDASSTLHDLKMKIQDGDGLPPDQAWLVFSGTLLADEARTLGDYGLYEGAVVHMALKFRPPSSSSSS